jgi:AraC family transcriptional regulator of arabinose operon
MKNMIFPLITEFEMKIPYYAVGIGYAYYQEYINRPKGFIYYQWIQCRKGKGELHIDGQTYTIEENQGMLLFPEIPHEYYALTTTWEVDWIIFGGNQVKHFVENTLDMKKSGVYFLSRPDVLQANIKKVYDVEKSQTANKSIQSSSLTYEIMLNILEFASEKSDSSMLNHYNRLKPLLDFIDKNYYKNVSLAELSGILQVTPEHLCYLFKKVTTHRVFEYINMTRIKKSKELIMQDKSLQIKDVAKKVGFEDISYFGSIFKKIEKVSPNEFKKLHI